jgi:hypothetical protein
MSRTPATTKKPKSPTHKRKAANHKRSRATRLPVSRPPLHTFSFKGHQLAYYNEPDLAPLLLHKQASKLLWDLEMALQYSIPNDGLLVR